MNASRALPRAVAAWPRAVERARSHWRTVAPYRFAALAISGALLLATPEQVVIAGPWWFLIALVALVVTVLQAVAPARLTAGLVVTEAFLLAMIVGAAPPEAGVLVLSLLVPALWAGRALPLGPALAITVAANGLFAALATAQAIPTADDFPPVQWMAIAIGITLVAAWSRRVGERQQTREQDYDRALDLLRQLAGIARRLPVGLDRNAVLAGAISAVQEIRPGASVAIYTRVDAEWLLERDTGGSRAGELARPGATEWDRAVHDRRARIVRDPDSNASIGLVPLHHRRSILGVARVVVDGPLGRTELRTIANAISGTAVQLEASAVFAQIREGAIAEERSRLSRQIHDGVAQDLAGLAYGLDSLALSVPDYQSQQAVEQSAAEIRRLVEELRFSIFDLRTELNDGERLGTALAAYVRSVGERSGIRVHVDIDDVAADVPTDVAHELMRIAQEAMTNARRHANASTIWVVLRIRAEGTLLRVSDNGRGLFNSTGKKSGDGVGLAIMGERAERLGATLTLLPRIGGGTVVECRLDQAAVTAKHPLGEAQPPDNESQHDPLLTRRSA